MSHWLTEEEQSKVIERLVESGLVTWSNARDLPLKSGGKTDVYINLRLMRNDSKMIAYLADLYKNPLGRLRVDRFVEVPDSVSSLAGHLSVISGLPFVTIRPDPKEGRVVKGKVIGDLRGRVAIIDDVITDGASKIPALLELKSRGINDPTLVVLVDRQQGWKKKLGDVHVWSGTTLHHVRKYLVSNGLMQRCDKRTEEFNPIIVALDGKDWEDILPILDPLRTTGCIFKVNDLLFDQGIERLLPNLVVYGRVMVDLKCHDIPNTVKNTCKRLRYCPPWAVTVHASGGEAMIRAAREGLGNDSPTKILAITVLTSIDPDVCEGVYHCQPMEQVLRLSAIADRAGADGFVCSSEEVGKLRREYPNKILVVPGVRSSGEDSGDQSRVGTPKYAKDNGADHVVMGRQILGNEDPVAEVDRVLAQELS